MAVWFGSYWPFLMVRLPSLLAVFSLTLVHPLAAACQCQGCCRAPTSTSSAGPCCEPAPSPATCCGAAAHAVAAAAFDAADCPASRCPTHCCAKPRSDAIATASATWRDYAGHCFLPLAEDGVEPARVAQAANLIVQRNVNWHARYGGLRPPPFLRVWLI